MNVRSLAGPTIHGRGPGMALKGPDRVKTQTPGRQFMNFSRFSAFSAITGPAERRNSLQMRRFQTISEFSHGLGHWLKIPHARGTAALPQPTEEARRRLHSSQVPSAAVATMSA